jgi:nicotinate-nucleotide adenylyltransferase
MDSGAGLRGIGLLGGTFDPIHNGHLRAALEVRDALGLPSVRLVPLNAPPHRDPPRAPAKTRVEMIDAAIRGVPELALDTREMERGGISYTLDTLKSLRDEFPGEPLFLLVGSDAFRHFPAWHRPGDILELAHLVVMNRPGEGRSAHYTDRVVDTTSALAGSLAGRILYQPVTQLDISATGIREMVKRGRSPRFLLPDAVLEILTARGLYRD